MEPESRHTLVGAAVLALIALLTAALIWLVGDGGDDVRLYTIHFENQSLEGLQIGSDVNMRGVKVGAVENYELSSQDINRVDVTIRVGEHIPVSDNTTAVVSRNLVTGLARIDLFTPRVPGPPLEAVPEGEAHPVIAEGSSGLDQIADALGRVTATGETVLANLEQLLDEENREQIVGAVAAARNLLSGLEQRLGRLDSLADNVEQTVFAFRDTASAFQGSARALEQTGRRTSAAVDSVASQVQPLVQDARGALAAFSSVARTFERESATLFERLETRADASGIELRLTARELRTSAEALARAAERLRDPSAAILGPSSSQLGPGEGGW